MRRLSLMLFIALLLIASLPLQAQDEPETTPEPPVYTVHVTTQDYVALREGPGQAFARVDVVPAAATIPAIGRTSDADWIQVQFGEKRGWIAAFLLVWSGDMLSLPADGINPVSYIRRRGPMITVDQTMLIYDQQFAAPGQQVNFPAETARVEVTGRLGSGDNYWLQFWYVDRYYWLGAWNLHLAVPGTFFFNVPDASYVYPYGRLLNKVYGGYGLTLDTYYVIRNIWNSLASGSSISCDNNPELLDEGTFSEADLLQEPVFVPAVRALQTAVTSTNSAVTRLQDACAQTGADRFLTTDVVNAALADLAEAGRNLDLVDILLSPVSNRDPRAGRLAIHSL